MKSILKSSLTIIAVLVLSVGVTSAYFTSKTKGADNVFSTGTVAVTLDTEEVVQGEGFFPGSEHRIGFEVENTGTLPVELKGYFSGEWDDGQLDTDVIYFRNPEALINFNWKAVKEGTLAPGEEIELKDSLTNSSRLNPGEKRQFQVTLVFDRDAGDEYQGAEFTSAIHIAAKQIAPGADWPAQY